MEEITVAIAVVALLMGFWREYQYYQLRGDYYELDEDIEELAQAVFLEHIKAEQFKEDVMEKVADYGDFTERLLKANKSK